MAEYQPTTAPIIFVLSGLVAVLATMQFATDGPWIAGVALLVISVVLLALGGYQMTRSRAHRREEAS